MPSREPAGGSTPTCHASQERREEPNCLLTLVVSSKRLKLRPTPILTTTLVLLPVMLAFRTGMSRPQASAKRMIVALISPYMTAPTRAAEPPPVAIRQGLGLSCTGLKRFLQDTAG